MANDLTSITTKIEIFKAELLMRLRPILGFVQLFPRNTNIGEYAQHGQTLNIPSVSITGGMTKRDVGGAVTASDVATTSTSVTMAQYYKGVKVDNLVNSITNVELMPRLATDLAQIVAEGIDFVLYELWKLIPYQVGKLDGTAAFNSTDKLNVLADARLLATRNKWPKRARRYGILTPEEATNILKLDQVQKVNEAGTDAAVREGELGRYLGFNLDECNTTDTTYTLGNAEWGTTPLAKGAHAIGAKTLVVDGLGTGSLPAGSIFSVGGNAYTVAEDATITLNEATITLNEPLKTAVADNAPITPVKHTAASGIGLLFDPNAFLFVNRPQAPFMPGTSIREETITDPVSGLTFRLLFESQGQGQGGDAMSQKITVDILCGAAVLRNQLATRMAGK